MNSLDETGGLKYVYCDEIDGVGKQYDEAEVKAAAKAIKAAKRNWTPILVKPVGQDKYVVVGNELVLQAALRAGFDRVWTIMVDDSAIAEGKVMDNRASKNSKEVSVAIPDSEALVPKVIAAMKATDNALADLKKTARKHNKRKPARQGRLTKQDASENALDALFR